MVREVDNLEAGLGAGLGMTAFGIMGVGSALGDAVRSAIRRKAYLQRVDALTRAAVRRDMVADREREDRKAEAEAFLAAIAIKRYNDGLREAA